MGSTAGAPRPSPAPAPQGSVEVRFERYTTFPGNALQVLGELAFTSYFFYGPLAAAVGGLLSPVALNVCSWRSLWCVVGAYFAQLVFHKPQSSRGWPYQWFMYSPCGDFVAHYHDSTVIREGPAPDPKGKYVFVMYPHGVYGLCRTFTSGSKLWCALFPGITSRWGSFSAAFMLPGVREMSLCAGCLDASKPVMERAIARGENITLLPGGIDEMNLTDDTSNVTTLVMKDRKGFVKLAIENGMSIVPGFCFGEKWAHRVWTPPFFIRRFLRGLRLSGTLVTGRGPTLLGFLEPSFGFVWGEPVPVTQQKPVDEAYLDEVHGQVSAAVSGIFERYKERFGYADEKLVMVSASEAKAFVAGKAAKRD